MENKYLEKVAILNLVGGYQGAKKKDKIGGTLVGATTGAAGAGILGGLGYAVGGAPGAAVGGLVGMYGGGVAGGKLYSKAKDLVTGRTKKK
ncbi:hypothetical protein D3C87_280110 [compost metagenome]